MRNGSWAEWKTNLCVCARTCLCVSSPVTRGLTYINIWSLKAVSGGLWIIKLVKQECKQTVKRVLAPRRAPSPSITQSGLRLLWTDVFSSPPGQQVPLFDLLTCSAWLSRTENSRAAEGWCLGVNVCNSLLEANAVDTFGKILLTLVFSEVISFYGGCR